MEARKLTMYQAEKIREFYFEKNATQSRLAQMFGVSKETIQNIVQKKTYKYDRAYGKSLY